MAPGRPTNGSSEPVGHEPGEGPERGPELAGTVRGLERRLLLGLAAAVVVVIGGYVWLRPDLGDSNDRQAVLLGLVSVLSLLSVAGLALVVPAISRIREGFHQRETVRKRLVDETERHSQRLEAYSRRLEQRNEDLRRFAYVVAHDLREPARIVSTHARLAQRKCDDRLDEDVREELDAAVEAAQHLDRLLGDLLVYVTLEQRVDDPEPVDLEEVADEAVARVAGQLELGGAEVETDALPKIRGHRQAIVRLFEELFSNAIKFTPDSRTPRIEVRAEEDEDGWTIAVEDEGMGMDPNLGDRVFSMFERLHPRQEIPGTGAGLSICRRVAELHGGDIEVESEPGEGTTFRVRIPRDPPAGAGESGPVEDEVSRLLSTE